MNTVNLIGNLTRDPEEYGNSGNTVAKFSLAINSGYGDKQRTDYIPVTVFGKSAENCLKYLRKGSKAGVVGRIQTGSYTNKKGDKVYTTDVIASNVEFLSRAETVTEVAKSEDLPPESGFTPMQDDDIPF